MSNWEIKKLKYFLKVKHGKEQKLIEDKNGIYPILASGGEIGRTNVYLYDKPSVLIGRKGTIDKPQYIEQPFWTIDTLFYTKVNDNNNAKFFYYLFQTINWHKYNEGSTIPSLNSTTIESIVVKVPPLEEQEKIVSILSKQDEVIEKLEKLIELKIRQKKGLMQQLLSGKLRLKGFSGEWKEDIMQSIILIFKKTKHNSSDGKNNGKYPFFINNSESFLKFLDEFDYDAECIIANTGGNAFFDYYNGKFSASSDCFIFSSKINTLFLYYFLKSIEKTVNIVGFAGSGIKHLNKKWFYKLKILIPPTIEEQSAIASILSKCDEEIELLKKKLGLYRGQKKWLMEKLLSGEIRV